MTDSDTTPPGPIDYNLEGRPYHNTTGGGSSSLWMPPQKITRWSLTSVADGTSGRGDMDAAQLRVLLTEGWEPFAVSGGRIWLRQKTETFQ